MRAPRGLKWQNKMYKVNRSNEKKGPRNALNCKKCTCKACKIACYHGNIRSPIYVLESLETQELVADLDVIYPYVSYTITSWGSVFATQIRTEIQAKQNDVIRLMFFATLHAPYTDSALPQLDGFTYWSVRIPIIYSFLNSLINGIKKIAKYL